MNISVIIPVKNGATTLARCLESIRCQQYQNQIEILVLDSGSTDSSVQIAVSYGAKVFEIDPTHFNHGLTRNHGVKLAQGDLLFFTVQDARLSDSKILENMSKWFDDQTIMGVSGHQAVPHEIDKNPILWFKRFTEPVPDIRQYVHNKSMPSYSWDNVISMYRKVSLENLPFEKTITGEDWIWAFNALIKGWKLVYDPSLVVYHYHHRAFLYVFKLEYGLYYTFYKKFNTVPSWPGWLLKNSKMVYHISRNKILSLNEKIFWISHNFSANTSHALAHLLFRMGLFIDKNQITYWLYLKICGTLPQGQQNKI